MATNYDNALADVNELYKDLVGVADDIVQRVSKPIDDIMAKLRNGFEDMSSRQLNDIMLQLSIEAYYFSSKKDHAQLKQACADALYKESFAKSYANSQGTQLNRQNQATVDCLDRNAVKILYDATSSLMKTKLDAAYRMVNVINSALISRNAEAKLGLREDVN